MMENSSLESMIARREYLKAKREELVEGFNNSTDREYKKKIVEEVKLIDEEYVELSKAIKEMKADKNTTSNQENYSEVKKKDTASRVMVGAALVTSIAALGVNLATLANVKGHANGFLADVVEENENKADKEEDKKNYTFTDASNEKQVSKRAQEFNDKYSSLNTGVNMASVEELANDIRMINGEFYLDNGEKTYNVSDIIATANDICTLANYSSFTHYGTDIKFIPYAPLFEDGSLAQQGAEDLDNAMEKVIKAINADDTEAFKEAAKEWGIVVVNMFDHIDSTGEYVNIHQMEPAQAYQLYQVMHATYSTSIFEYGQARNVNVCIPYCTNYSTGELTDVALSEIMYQINEIPRDAVAVRSGHQDEYAENNLSLPEQLYVEAVKYYNDKYDLEFNNKRVLK